MIDPFSTQTFLRLAEAHGLSGSWDWTFATEEQVWSAGLWRLLGLEPGALQPSYDRLLDLVHPEDRGRMARPADLRAGAVPEDGRVRIVCSDGATRLLSVRYRVLSAPDGRPRAVSGLVLDRTVPSQLLWLRDAERRYQFDLLDRARSYAFRYGIGQPIYRPSGFSRLFKATDEELRADDLAAVAPEFRGMVREIMGRSERLALPYQGSVPLLMADGSREAFRNVLVPERDGHGTVIAWNGLTFPDGHSRPLLHEGIRVALEQQVQGRHLRAARALLDWSMANLAEASGLSLSTVRRLEEDGAHRADRSRHRAVAALRVAGIRFRVLADGTVAVAVR